MIFLKIIFFSAELLEDYKIYKMRDMILLKEILIFLFGNQQNIMFSYVCIDTDSTNELTYGCPLTALQFVSKY